MSEKILVTGASGRVGRAAGRHLCEQGHEVIGVSRSVEESECYTEVESVDLLEEGAEERLSELLKDADAVFHLAWNLSEENFDTGKKWPGNMEMYSTVMSAAREAEVPIFINGSSIHAGTGSIPAYKVEASLEDTPEPYRSSIDPGSDFDLRRDNPEKLLSPLEDDPGSPYGESKVETEHMLRDAVRRGDFRLGVSIRIGGVNQDDRQVIEDEPYYSSLYWSHRDLGRTVENILTADLEDRNGYHQFYGISDNEGRVFSIENGFIGESV
jgi:nucleoside-diphosphate-sugar epimerase